MPGPTFSDAARWFLIRILFVLLGALTVAVAVRQFIDYEDTASMGDEAPATAGPKIGDHWHAAYRVVICGQQQPPLPAWVGGVHTHADGVIHIHPFTIAEQGEGASLSSFFSYGGGRLTDTEMRLPGDDRTYHNGDDCPDGSAGVLQIFVGGKPMEDWSQYIPQDGDRILIVFGPEGG